MSMTPQCDFAFRLIDQGACLATSSDGVFLQGGANQIFIESIDGVPRRGFEACQEMVKAEALRRNGTCKLPTPPPVTPPGDGGVTPPVIPVCPSGTVFNTVTGECDPLGFMPPPDEPPVTPPVTPPGDLIPGIPNIVLIGAGVAAAVVGGIAVGAFVISRDGRLF